MANVKTVNLNKAKMKAYLLEHGYNFYDLSKEIGMLNSYLSNLLNKNDMGMSKTAYLVLCNQLGVDTDMFLQKEKTQTRYDKTEVDMLYLLSDINAKLSTVIALLNLERN